MRGGVGDVQWLTKEFPVDEILAAIQVEAGVEGPVLVCALVLPDPIPSIPVLHDPSCMCLDRVAFDTIQRVREGKLVPRPKRHTIGIQPQSSRHNPAPVSISDTSLAERADRERNDGEKNLEQHLCE